MDENQNGAIASFWFLKLMVKYNCAWTCLGQTKSLLRPVHRGCALNDIPQGLAGVKYLILINASSGYHNLKLNEKFSYLTMFS